MCGDWETRTEKHGDIGFDTEWEFSPKKVHTYGGIRMYRCSSITVTGVTVTDTATYGMRFFAGSNIKIDDVNVTGLWKYNCDGIDFINCSNVCVKDTFIRSFDDSMCMKGFTAFSDMNTEDVLVENTVFWCDWGKNLEIGLATAAKEIKNITWRNCDIIHNAGSCITISNGMWADVHDILFEDIRVEYAADTEKYCIQTEDSQEYIPDGETHIPALIVVHDERRNWHGNISYDDERTKIRDVLINNISVTLEDCIREIPNIIVVKKTKLSTFENIIIENIFVNGEKIEINKGYNGAK